MGEISLSCVFLVFFVTDPKFLITSRGQTVEPIFTLFDSLDVSPRLLHSYEINLQNFAFTPIFTPKKLPQRGRE